MNIGLIIIGDEILSGRRSDKHLPKVIEILNQRGLLLSWVRILGDDPGILEDELRSSFAKDHIVFSLGGIGATPDDLTREAAANALNSVTEHHPDGVKILEEIAQEHDIEVNDDLLRLVAFPKHSELIHNANNRVPGFSINHHHFVPGFPDMAWPMIEWVLDTKYPDLRNDQFLDQSLMVYGQFEHAMIPIMDTLLAKYEDIKVYCLPSIDIENPKLEFGIKGHPKNVKLAMQDFKVALKTMEARWERAS